MKVDRPGEVRDELDVARLSEFLGLPVTVEQFRGGYSNLTYLLHTPEGDQVLRRPPRGANIKSAHDMEREFRLLSALHPAWGRVPRPLRMVTDESVLGAPFYLMERVQGVILRGPGDERCTPDLMRRLSEQIPELLAELHGLQLDLPGRPDGYVARQVQGWSERWHRAATHELPEAGQITSWLAANRPPESGATLIHNDFKYDNLVLDPADPTRVLAVLDWEMATLGDPLMDLGTTLGYWVEAGDAPELQALGFGPTFRSGNLTRAELAERYAQLTGRSFQPFYLVFGLFKIAVIAQQIYARWRAGHSRDPRFEHLDRAVRLLLAQAVRQLSLP